MTAQEKGITFYIVITAHYIDLPAKKQARNLDTPQKKKKKFEKKKKKKKERKKVEDGFECDTIGVQQDPRSAALTLCRPIR